MLLQFVIKADKAEDIESQARRVIDAGINWIEIDAPVSVSDAEMGDMVGRLRPLLAEKGVVLIIGARFEAAKEWQADGVHVYSSERPVSAVRVALEAWPIIGVDVDGREAAESLRAYDIDYLYYRSDGTAEALETVREIARYLDENEIETPLVCGGDVTPANLTAHVKAGAAAVATSDMESLPEMLRLTRDLPV